MTPILSDLKTTAAANPLEPRTFSQTATPAIGRERKKWPGVSISF